MSRREVVEAALLGEEIKKDRDRSMHLAKNSL